MEGLTYTDLIKCMTWSYSRITSFEQCRYQWFTKYIDGALEEDMFYASYGKFMHSILERYYNGKLSKDDMEVEFLTGFSKNVGGSIPSGSIVSKYIEKGCEYLRNFQPFPYKTIAVEDRIDFVIKGYPFIGFIDYLGEKDGEYIIVDHKSRELKQRSKRKKPTKKDEELDEMLRQLYIYSAAVKSKYGKFPKYLCFNCFRNGEFIETEFDMDKYNETIDWAVNSIREIEKATDFYPDIDYFRCRNLCGFYRECCYNT